MEQIPITWQTERLTIANSQKDEVPELQTIYDECAYIGNLTGFDDDRKNPMMLEFTHETLPPDGKPELHRLQTITESKSGSVVGYLITYHGFPDAETFWIATLAIRPSFQRQKLGKEAIDELTKLVKKLNWNRMGISVGVGNDPAIKFWSLCGFVDIIHEEDHTMYKDQWRVKLL